VQLSATAPRSPQEEAAEEEVEEEVGGAEKRAERAGDCSLSSVYHYTHNMKSCRYGFLAFGVLMYSTGEGRRGA
jgi:hypothetical protein